MIQFRRDGRGCFLDEALEAMAVSRPLDDAGLAANLNPVRLVGRVEPSATIVVARGFQAYDFSKLLKVGRMNVDFRSNE